MENIALEIIAYQNNDPFPGKLTKKIENIYEDIRNKKYKNIKSLIKECKYVKEIEELIQNRFNMNIVFSEVWRHYEETDGAIYPFFGPYLRGLKEIEKIGINNLSKSIKAKIRPRKDSEIFKEKREIFSTLDNRRGYIDFKNVRVGGYLSEVKHYLIINFFSYYKIFKITPAEIAAIILHEIGHAFMGLAYHHKLESTNETIGNIINEINKNNPDKAVYIFKKNFKIEEFKDISASNNKEIYDFYGKIALAYLNEIRTQLVNSKYDETSFENLSDSFASRFNMGKEFASALHKLDNYYDYIIRKDAYRYFLLINIIRHVVALVLFNIPGVIIMGIIIGTIYNSDIYIMNYDFPIDRYNRIKNTIINNLKNINLPEDIAKDLIEQFNFVNKIIEEFVDFKDVKMHIADTILSSNRNNNYYIKLQQSIEDNLNNLLFVKAQQLRLS